LRSLLPLFLMFALSLYALLSWAHEGELDSLGCHGDVTTESYHCHTGPLAGREFISPDEAADALDALNEQKLKDQAQDSAIAGLKAPLRMLSWNFSSIGTKRFEYDRIVSLIAEADFLVMQDVEFNATGESALTVISGLLSRRLGQRICKGWFRSNAGDRGRHAFLWRDSVVSFVEKNGMISETCPDAPVIIRVEGNKLDKNSAFTANFFLKARRQMFSVASIQLENKPKRPDKEIGAVFSKLNKLPWPTVVAGNFKVGAKDKAFNEATKLNFKAVLARKGGATSNLWTKNLSVVHAEAVDLQKRFPELSSREVEAMISSFPPLLAEISFSPEEADALKTQLVKRNAREKTVKKVKAPRPEPRKTTQKRLPVHDDLEHEVEEP